MTNNQVNLNDINFIRTGPRGKSPVVLVHAVGMDLTMWVKQIEVLHKEYDVIAIDIPGHGFSEKLTGELTFEKFAAAIILVIESLNAGPVHLVGISFGSMIIQTVALERPDLIRSLSLIGSAATFLDAGRTILAERSVFLSENGTPAVVPQFIARYFTPEYAKRRPDVIDQTAKMLNRMDTQYYAGIWKLISTLDNVEQLKTLAIPAMVIIGEQDTSTPLAAAEILAAALSTSRIYTVSNASHLTNIEAPDAINDLLISFLVSIH